MVKRIYEELMDVGPLVAKAGIVIHNDYGSNVPEWYVDWLRYRNKELGIAHFYATKDTIAQVIALENIGYHTGDWQSNERYVGIEVCQSVSASDADFKANEEMVFMLGAEILHKFGLQANNSTVRLHREFVPTACPHRSWALYGENTKRYFIERVGYWMTKGKTVEEMLANTNSKQVVETKKEEEVEQMDYVVRSKSGKQGYIGAVNGAVFGIGDIATVSQLQAAGAKHLTLDDGDFVRFLESQKFDDEKLVASVDKLTEQISKQE